MSDFQHTSNLKALCYKIVWAPFANRENGYCSHTVLQNLYIVGTLQNNCSINNVSEQSGDLSYSFQIAKQYG